MKDNGYRKAQNEYKRQSIVTASKEELTLSLYNGCIKFINEAIKAVDEKNYQQVNYFTQRAQDIIVELACSLDMSYDISHDMKRLYDYVHDMLIEGNIQKNKEPLESASDIIKEFRNTWYEAMKLSTNEKKKNVV